jgi:outer membrane protein insertion porin family
VQLNGGVSGIAGSFLGFSYATNNFLGLGETLSISSQIGDRIRDVTFSFTEPYFLDKPIQVGFTVFIQRFNYNQGREVSLLSGRNLIPLFQQLGTQNLLNYTTNGRGFTVFANYPLKRSFARLGLSYGFNTQDISTDTTASQQYFEFINFQQALAGPNQLRGIKTSQLIPSYTYNTVNHPITPTAGKSIFISTNFAGSVLGGNVNTLEPTVDLKYFRSGFKRGHVIGMHGLFRFLTGYGGKVAPPFNRFFMGGENDIRGFNIWGISPIAYVPSTASVPVLNADGSPRTQTLLDADGKLTPVPVTQQVPVYQLVFPGGDGQGVVNFEYRIPIVGPVILAAFADVGANRILRRSQLQLNDDRVLQLNSQFPEANFDRRAVIAPGTQNVRMSTGLELQVLMPVVNAPFRFYWAYNPLRANTILAAPLVADRSFFPNQATYLGYFALYGRPQPFAERTSIFRFSIGRTF